MFGWDDILKVGMDIIDKVIPDPTAKATAQLELVKLQQAGQFKQLETDLAMAQGQMDINKVEASSEDLFKSGWRPFLGWVCGVAFAAKYLGGPLAFVAAQWFNHPIQLPPIDMTEMLPLLMGMLGLGAMRSVEKIKGTT